LGRFVIEIFEAWVVLKLDVSKLGFLKLERFVAEYWEVLFWEVLPWGRLVGALIFSSMYELNT
jgi:hypothetical protein